jgi:predicted RNA-binding protein with RPS1 domain
MEELGGPEKRDVKKNFPKGKEMKVEIISIDEKGRILLSQKVMEEREDREDYRKFVETEGKSSNLGTLGDIFKNLKLG